MPAIQSIERGREYEEKWEGATKMENKNGRVPLATFFPNPIVCKNKIGEYIYNWKDFLPKLEKHKTIGYSVEEYRKMKKNKDKSTLAINLKSGNGYYQMGPANLDRNGLPSCASGIPKPTEFGMCSIDADGVEKAWMEKAESILAGYEYYIHSTISSCNEDFRIRILIPFNHNVNYDVYNAFIRILCGKIGMAGVDKTCAEPKRNMSMPVYCKDAEPLKKHGTGEFIDAEKWLEANAGVDWHDISKLPLFDKETEHASETHKGKGKSTFEEKPDWIPYPNKNPVINGFNKAYRVSEILTEYGNGEYEQTGETRWTYVNGTTTNGIAVSHDSVLCSWHGTDKLNVGHPVDAFTVFCILQNISKEDGMAIAREDERVRRALITEIAGNLPVPDSALTWATRFGSTEEDIARRAMEMFHDKRCRSKWYAYENGFYHLATDSEIADKALDAIRVAHAVEPENQQIEKMVGKNSKRNAVMSIWQGKMDRQAIKDDEWEPFPYYVNFLDYTVDMEKVIEIETVNWTMERFREAGAILEHSPNYLLLNQIPLRFEDVMNNDFADFGTLWEAMDRMLPNPEVQNYVWRGIGSCLYSNAFSDAIILWFNGPSGGNGKTTLLEAVKNAIGDGGYAQTSKVAIFYKSNNDNNGESPSPALDALRHCKLSHFAEGDSNRTLNASKLKEFAGGGKVVSRTLHDTGGPWSPAMRLIFDSNGMCSVDNFDGGLFRRLRIIPFTQKLDRIKDDGTGSAGPEFQNRMKTDKHIHAAIVRQMMIGLQDWHRNGKRCDNGIDSCPKEIQQMTKAFWECYRPVTEWFEDYITITNDDVNFVESIKIYNKYLETISTKEIKKHTFFMALAEWIDSNGNGAKPAKRDCKHGYTGITLEL